MCETRRFGTIMKIATVTILMLKKYLHMYAILQKQHRILVVITMRRSLQATLKMSIKVYQNQMSI